MAKKRVLPKSFFSSMGTATLDQLIAVYDDHLITAYQSGDRAKRTPLFWALTPNGLVEWLVQQGLDVNGPDANGVTPLMAQADTSATYPETPQRYPGKVRLLLSLGADVHQRGQWISFGECTALHIAAFRGAGAAVETLLEHGAEVDARDDKGRSALELAVSRANLRTLDSLPGVVAPLVAAGARITSEMRDAVALVGREIHAVAAGSAPADAARRAAAYARLAPHFDLDPTPDGAASGEIFVPRASWSAQHRALWGALVPAAGPAPTVQGEVIRVSGRIGREVLEMGGVNWDDDYRAMLAHLPVLLANGVPLDDETLTGVHKSAWQLSTGKPTQHSARRVAALQQAAVAWVSLNRTPIPLQAPPYQR